MSAPSNQTYASGYGQVSGDNLNTFVQNVANVTGLRGFIGTAGMNVYLMGTTTTNDGGQGFFYWNASGTGPDDNGVTNVVPSGAATGCWTRIYGAFQANGSVATAMSSLGPTGSHTTIQEWLKITNASGVTRYIPCF